MSRRKNVATTAVSSVARPRRASRSSAPLRRVPAPRAGAEELVAQRVVDRRDGRPVAVLQRHGRAPVRHAEHEVRGAVEPVDHPAPRRPGDVGALLAEQAVVGPARAQQRRRSRARRRGRRDTTGSPAEAL